MLSNIERHIGIWQREGSERSSIGELVVNGNLVEFYVRDAGNSSPAVYLGGDVDSNYKVVTGGISQWDMNNTLDKAASYNVQYVLKQNYPVPATRRTSGILGFSFIIPELMDWFPEVYTVKILESSKQVGFCAGEDNFPEIILHDSSPKISIRCESSSWNETMRVDSRTEIIIKNQPRIFVTYDSLADTERVQNDVRCLMRFWGLIIGRVTDAMDIRLNLEGTELYSWLYINCDLGYRLS